MKKLIGLFLGLCSLGLGASADVYLDNTLPTLEDCYAQAVPMESHSRWYLGALLGGDYNRLDTDFSLNAKSTSIHTNSHESRFGFRPGLYGGFGWNWRHLYLGLELSANYHWLNIKDHDRYASNYSADFKKTEYTTAVSDVLIGYLTRNRSWLYYLKFGMGTDWDKINCTIYNGTNQLYSKTRSHLNFKWEGGLGAEWMCTNNFSIRYELLYGRNNGTSLPDDHVSGYNVRYQLKGVQSIMLNLGMAIVF